MTLSSIKKVLLRDLDSVAAQVNAYPREEDLWIRPPGVVNPGGTLARHLCGNLQHFIGRHLGGAGFERDRDGEFSRTDVPRAEILAEVARARDAVEAALDSVEASDMDAEFPAVPGGTRLSTGRFLLHLAGHLAYHLGQIDYHRRVVTGTRDAVPMLSIRALGE